MVRLEAALNQFVRRLSPLNLGTISLNQRTTLKAAPPPDWHLDHADVDVVLQPHIGLSGTWRSDDHIVGPRRCRMPRPHREAFRLARLGRSDLRRETAAGVPFETEDG